MNPFGSLLNRASHLMNQSSHRRSPILSNNNTSVQAFQRPCGAEKHVCSSNQLHHLQRLLDCRGICHNPDLPCRTASGRTGVFFILSVNELDGLDMSLDFLLDSFMGQGPPRDLVARRLHYHPDRTHLGMYWIINLEFWLQGELQLNKFYECVLQLGGRTMGY